jgi:uncharacterized cupin superfamily protein
VSVPNIGEPEFDEPREVDGFRARRARLGHQLRTERLGISLWEVEPGQRAYPYHFHFNEEELVVMLEGALELRTPAGTRTLHEGDIASFPVGEAGAHQLLNATDAPVRFLSVSTHGTPDIVFYPDSGKVGIGERLPRGGGVRHNFRVADAVDYYDGEM